MAMGDGNEGRRMAKEKDLGGQGAERKGTEPGGPGRLAPGPKRFEREVGGGAERQGAGPRNPAGGQGRGNEPGAELSGAGRPGGGAEEPGVGPATAVLAKPKREARRPGRGREEDWVGKLGAPGTRENSAVRG